MTVRNKHSLLSYGVAFFAAGYVLIGLGLAFGAKSVTSAGFGLATVGATMVFVFLMRDDAR